MILLHSLSQHAISYIDIWPLVELKVSVVFTKYKNCLQFFMCNQFMAHGIKIDITCASQYYDSIYKVTNCVYVY